jgi:predicted nucleic acid-binding protein
MSRALIADTGGLLRALAVKRDGKPTWPDYAAALREASFVVVPSAVLVEVDYFLRGERIAMQRLVSEIFDARTTYEFEADQPADIVRALRIDAKFPNLGLGLTDGIVAAVAERRRVHRILTTDRRDFGVVRIGPRYDQALSLVP